MSALPAATAALGSALSYAMASVLQHRAARQAPAGRGLHVGLVAHLATRPIWLAGLIADVAALALHVFALSKGELALVQPLLVSGLLFALPASVLLEHRHPSLTEWTWAALLIGALSLFLVVGHPSVGHNLTDTDRLAVLTAAGSALTAGVVLIAKQIIPGQQAALLGLAAGIAFGLTAALLKQTTNIGTGTHPLQLVSSWPLYALITIGAAALVLSQAAYQSGPLAASLPPLTMADPVVAHRARSRRLRRRSHPHTCRRHPPGGRLRDHDCRRGPTRSTLHHPGAPCQSLSDDHSNQRWPVIHVSRIRSRRAQPWDPLDDGHERSGP